MSSENSAVANVGIVIVSHSPKIAEGAADMVRQMVGDAVPLAHTGGNSEGGLGTDVAAIIAAIERAWSKAGVAILVDLGGAETNSEMAVEMLDHDRRALVVICNAPIAGSTKPRRGMPAMAETRYAGRSASPGFAAGRIVPLAAAAGRRTVSGDPEREAASLRAAMAAASRELAALAANAEADAAEI